MLKTDIKKRNWTLELYNDSSDPDWEQKLLDIKVPFAFIYHDKDKNPTGEQKKPHFHVLLCYDGPTTYSSVKELGEKIGCANGIVQPVGSVRGMIRYFVHLDNPEKYQYNECDIQCRNGFDPKDYFSLTVSQQKAFKRKVTEFIADNQIEEYADLIDTLISLDEMDMYDVASQNVFYFTSYIKSKKALHIKKEADKVSKRKTTR